MSTPIASPQRHTARSSSEENTSATAEGSTPNPASSDPQPAATATTTTTVLPSAIEFEPPLACIRRILKNALPSSTNVGKDASAAFTRASGIFIIYLTACANDFARENKRQTITANDVLAAIKELNFDEFTPEMLAFLESYRQSEKSKKNAKAAAKHSNKDEITPTEEEIDEDDDEDEDDDDEVTDRKRRSSMASHDDKVIIDNKNNNDDDDDETDVDEENSNDNEPSTKRMKTDTADTAETNDGDD